jgi:uncharacterized protein YndB with AHSA1/START domain
VTTPVAVSTDIAASPQAVWELVADLPRMGEWSPENEGAEWLHGARGATVGATFKGANRHGTRSWTTKGTIVAADPGRTLAFRITVAGLKIAEWRYELVATEQGCTVTETFIDERGWLPKKLGGPLSGVDDRESHNRATMTSTLERLKQAAESPTPGG